MKELPAILLRYLLSLRPQRGHNQQTSVTVPLMAAERTNKH